MYKRTLSCANYTNIHNMSLEKVVGSYVNSVAPFHSEHLCGLIKDCSYENVTRIGLQIQTSVLFPSNSFDQRQLTYLLLQMTFYHMRTV